MATATCRKQTKNMDDPQDPQVAEVIKDDVEEVKNGVVSEGCSDAVEQVDDHPNVTLVPLIELVLGSDSPRNEALEELQQFFLNKLYIINDTVDVFLHNYLVVVLDQNAVFRQAAQRIIFNDDSRFLRKLLLRTIHSAYGEDPSISPENTEAVFLFLLETSNLLRNIPKFLEYLLKAVKASKLQNVVLPSKFIEILGNFAVKMPISQNMSIWTTLSEILNKNLTTESKDAVFPQVRLAAEFLGTCMLNVQLADNSVYEETINQVMQSFVAIVGNLKSLVQLALKQPQEYIVPLLTLAFAYGELHQLLLLYSQPYSELNQVKPILQDQELESVWNLTYFHTYATGEEWESLGQLTAETQTILWAPLVLQKIRFMVMFAGRSKGDKLVRKLVAFLIDHFSVCETLWLNNVKYLLPSMSPKHLDVLGRRMVNSPTWSQMLQDVDLVDKRNLQMAIAVAVFQAILERSRKRKAETDDATLLRPSSQTVLQVLTQQPELWIGSTDRAVKEVVTWLRKAAENLRASMKSDSESGGCNVEETARVLEPLNLLDKLPLEYATGTFHSTVMMGLLSVLLSLDSEVDAKSKDRIWMMLIRMLDNPEKLSSLYDYIPSEEFVEWTLTSTKHLAHSGEIFSSVFDEVLRSPQGLKDAAKWVATSRFHLHFDVMVIAMEKLGQHWQTVANEEKKALSLQMFTSMRKSFLDHFEAAVEEHGVHVLRGALSLLEMHLKEPQPKKVFTLTCLPHFKSLAFQLIALHLRFRTIPHFSPMTPNDCYDAIERF